MRQQTITVFIIAAIWFLLIPISIGLTDFLGILATLILFYPLFIFIVCGAFLFGFIFRKKHSSKDTLLIASQAGLVLTIAMLYQMRDFLEPGLFSMEQSDFYLMGIMFYALLMAFGYAGIFVRTIINPGKKQK